VHKLDSSLNSNNISRCPLCLELSLTTPTLIQKRTIRSCSNCYLLSVCPSEYLTEEDEYARYLCHENTPRDDAYCTFLSKLSDPLSEILPKGSSGLDFGCGPGPTLSFLMNQKGFLMHDYDPFFFPDESLLQRKYDFITSTEVFEHLYEPRNVLDKLLSIIKPNGFLAIMTEIIPEDSDLEDWHYIKEPSHVQFYHTKTMEWIKDKHILKMLTPHKNVRIFQLPGSILS
jgi:SAM-dependent methyltransferase